MLARFLVGTGMAREEVEAILVAHFPGAGTPQIVADLYAPIAEAA
jgi:hypothetical protein